MINPIPAVNDGDQKNMLPLPALVGLDLAQQALLLLAVEPRLRGVLLAAGAGTGKSSLARGMAALLPDAPFVELPSSVDIDNLLGYPDLESTLRTGKLVFQAGVLARAHNGTLHVDGINMLSETATNVLMGAVEERGMRIEREGVSRWVESAFVLVASYDPQEAAPRQHLMERVGLIVTLPSQINQHSREEVIRRNLADGAGWDDDVALLCELVATARAQLPSVTITDEQIEQLSATALAYGVEGHRVDLFAMRAACAAAALSLREEVVEDDLNIAVQLVIVPRATRIPAQKDEDGGMKDNAEGTQPQDNREKGEWDEGEEEAAVASADSLPQEQIFDILTTDLPAELLDLPFQHVRRGRTGSRGSTTAKRGRHVRSVPGDPRQQRIDVAATLRSAAPWQRVRAAQAAAEKRVHLTLCDVRVKQYRSKAGALFVFVVDASGSMALHRMRQAKGAVQVLLEQAYVNRDRVALISCRGAQAEILLQPTQAVAAAQRALEVLPTGGGTPLASALLQTLTLAKQAQQRGIMQTVMVVLTDGRANVGLIEGRDVNEEIQGLGRIVVGEGIRPIIIDTQRSYLSRGEAKQLAQWLCGEYVYLPTGEGEEIAAIAAGTLVQ